MPVENGKNSKDLTVPGAGFTRACQSCGLDLGRVRRRYCSPDCRKKLVLKLVVATNLLRAMHTQYATFTFTEDSLVLNVVVCGARDVHTYFWKRSPQKKPADDLALLVEELGVAWWKEKNRKGSRHQASRHVLNQAKTGVVGAKGLVPRVVASPMVPSRHLTMLRLPREDIIGRDALSRIKAAYRKAAVKHHPDKDGNAADFRKVHEAYQELLNWMRNPKMRNSTGLPGKWCYKDGRWAPPLPVKAGGR